MSRPTSKLIERFSSLMSTESQLQLLDPELQALLNQLLQSGACDIHQIVIAEVERQILQQVLTHCNGNISRASRVLGISRMTLRRKLAVLPRNCDYQIIDNPPATQSDA